MDPTTQTNLLSETVSVHIVIGQAVAISRDVLMLHLHESWPIGTRTSEDAQIMCIEKDTKYH